ncbi:MULTISPECIES: AAA family ATPase [Bacteroides]|uniref:AAA family ATPase n=1 Tax=Bacteroides TaxID=816 RepID=UPI00189AF3BE|nr:MULTISPECIES: AAA family ATPase [Bacteroides]
MINKIRIRNFKSIVDLTLDLGRVNVIIGANGCGKTNILEAITFASMAGQDKLGNEYLFNRGVRITAPQYMMNAFDDANNNVPIQIDVEGDNKAASTNACILYNESKKEWFNIGNIVNRDKIQAFLSALTQDGYKISDIARIENDNPDLFQSLQDLLIEKPSLASFLIYRPIENVLREANTQSPIQPLGIRGEGLLQYLKQVSQNIEYKSLIENINEGLFMLDWFDGFNIPDDLLSNEYKLSIGDRYLNESLHYFDQRSTNEGFLYLLFYLTLFNSKETPSFFAVDNIETSFNPKLCIKLSEYLISAAQKNNKQVILTTHNPYILDGLDLSDDEVRLFVARRDLDGHTRVTRIPYKRERVNKLSDVWMKGYIGGLPDNF